MPVNINISKDTEPRNHSKLVLVLVIMETDQTVNFNIKLLTALSIQINNKSEAL